MIIWGINAINHDASLCVFETDLNKILFASSSERFSKIKNDEYLNEHLINYAYKFGYPAKIYWSEKPIIKKLRQIYSLDYRMFNPHPSNYLKKFDIQKIPISYINHHQCHASFGYYTSPFNEAIILVIDAIGEWDTITVWQAKNGNMKRIFREYYPNSIGLLYSAMTQRCGFKPNEEEYIMMGLAAHGTARYQTLIKHDFIKKIASPHFKLKQNIHTGITNWRKRLKYKECIASSIQYIYERYLIKLCEWAVKRTNTSNIILSGGCALNCVANSKLLEIYPNLYVSPNPGDSGNCIGAILSQTKKKIEYSPFLGYKLQKRKYHIENILQSLSNGKIIGIVKESAEFGPRALGNRSLIADPRISNIKDRMNYIKGRENFRPFAPMINYEDVNNYFECNKHSPYMQYTFKCKEPNKYPGIVHIDKTSRLQTVKEDENPQLYKLIKLWKNYSNCPMLINTSLNIKGQPIVNDENDIYLFMKKYNIEIL